MLKCTGDTCPIKEDCLRYREDTSEDGAYSTGCYDTREKKCCIFLAMTRAERIQKEDRKRRQEELRGRR